MSSKGNNSLVGTSGEQSSKEYPDILQSRIYFPAVSDLPDEFVVDMRYCVKDSDGFYSKMKTWCFLGTICDDDYAHSSQNNFMRNRSVVVLDRDNTLVPILFYPADTNQKFKFSRLKWGRTIAILYCHKHIFQDEEVYGGLRVEDLSTVMVLNCTLEQLQALSAHYWSHKDKEKCWACGTAKPVQELQKCAKCKVAKYCSKECQTADWLKQHKIWCRAMPEFVKLAGFDYSVPLDTVSRFKF